MHEMGNIEGGDIKVNTKNNPRVNEVPAFGQENSPHEGKYLSKR